MRKVVVLSDTAFIDGGGAAVALRSAIGIARSGVDVSVVSAVGPAMPDLLDEPNLRVLCTDQEHLAASTGAFGQGLWNRSTAAMVESVLNECDRESTIVHVHGWTKALSSSVFKAATALGFKIVVTLHDYFSICPNGSLYIHPKKEICKIDPMSLRCIMTDCDSRNYGVKAYRVGRQAIQAMVGGMPGRVHGFISVSDFSRRIIEPHLPSGSKIYPVRNPINYERSAPATPESYDRFLYVGRLSPEKGVTFLAKAARDAGIRIAFAGDGPCLAEIVGINPQAKILGWLSAGDVARELRASRCLVLPSLWYETYGLSVMEAAAAGVPSIVPDTSAARDLVDDGHNGMWFEGGNSRSLIEKLTNVGQAGVAERLGSNAYERYWNDPPTMSNHVSQLLDVYESVLGNAA